MKRSIFLLILIFPLISSGQADYYKIITDSTIFNEYEFNLHFKAMIKALPKDYSLTPIIYHKYKNNDSIINYVYFKKIWWGNLKVDSSKFEIEYKQDTLLLFLNKRLPEFTLTDLDGNKFSSLQLHGKPSLINFWATNCRGCILEMLELNKLQIKYFGKVNFVAISLDSEEIVESFLKNNSFSFYHLVDGGKYAKDSLRISGIPVNMFLDRKGYLREVETSMPLKNNRYSGISVTPNDLSNLEFDKILQRLLK